MTNATCRAEDILEQNRLDPCPNRMDTSINATGRADARRRWRNLSLNGRPRDNNTLHTEPRAARLLETMVFAAAR